MASLLAAAAAVPSLATWAEQIRTEPEIRELLTLDESRDRSEELTRSWMQAVIDEFAKRRITLRPAAVRQQTT
jgi:hypothetical protein